MTTRIGIKVPPGLSSGEAIQFQTPDGTMMQAHVPPGVAAGQIFYVEVATAGVAAWCPQGDMRHLRRNPFWTSGGVRPVR